MEDTIGSPFALTRISSRINRHFPFRLDRRLPRRDADSSARKTRAILLPRYGRVLHAAICPALSMYGAYIRETLTFIKPPDLCTRAFQLRLQRESSRGVALCEPYRSFVRCWQSNLSYRAVKTARLLMPRRIKSADSEKSRKIDDVYKS